MTLLETNPSPCLSVVKTHYADKVCVHVYNTYIYRIVESINFRGMTVRKVSWIYFSRNSSLSSSCMHAILNSWV